MKDQFEQLFRKIIGIKEGSIDELSQENCPSWDSLKHAQLIIEIQESLGIHLEIEELAELNSVEKIFKKIDQQD